jgi:hypothetical protein
MRLSNALLRVFTVGGVALACGACGTNHEGASSTQSGLGNDTVSCEADPRVATYTAHLDESGSHGLTFELVSADPAPPAKFGNSWVVMVKDSDGTPLTGTLGVGLNMPSHGHGTQVPPVITFDAATSTYTIDPVYLFMPGVWQITLDYYGDAGTDADPVDEASFFFCIEG